MRSLGLTSDLLQLDDSRLESPDSNLNPVSEASNIYEIDGNPENNYNSGSYDYYNKLSNADYDSYANLDIEKKTETGQTNSYDKSTKPRISSDYFNLDNTPHYDNENQHYYSSNAPHYYGGDRKINVQKTAYIVPANVNGKIINAEYGTTNTDDTGDFDKHPSEDIVNNFNINSKFAIPVTSSLQSIILNRYPNYFSNNCNWQHHPHNRRDGFVIINGQRYAVDDNVLNYIISQKRFNTLNEQDAYNFIIINGEKYALDHNILKYILSQKQLNIPNKQHTRGFVIINGRKYALDSNILKYVISQKQSNPLNERDSHNFVLINGEKYAIDKSILQYVLSHKDLNVSKKRHAHIVVIINGDKYALHNNILQYILTHKKSNVPNSQYPHSFVIINGEKYALDYNILQYILSHKQSNTLNERYAHSSVIINGVKYALDVNVLKYILSHKQSNINNRPDVNKVETYIIENQNINDGSINDLDGQNQVFDDKVVKYLNPKQREIWRSRYSPDIEELDEQSNENDVKIVFPEKNINPTKDTDTEILDLDIDNSNNAQIDNVNQIIVEPGSTYDVNVEMEQKLAIERKHNLAQLKEFLLSIVLQKVSSIEKMNVLYNNVLNYIVVLDSRDVPKWVIAQLIRKIQQQVLNSVKRTLLRQNLYSHLNLDNLCSRCRQLNA